MANTGRIDTWTVIGAIAIPTLLLWGDADPSSPEGVGPRLASLRPAAHRVLLPGGTHDLAIERAAGITPRIDRLLEHPS